MDNLAECLGDITNLNLIYTLVLLATVKTFDDIMQLEQSADLVSEAAAVDELFVLFQNSSLGASSSSGFDDYGTNIGGDGSGDCLSADRSQSSSTSSSLNELTALATAANQKPCLLTRIGERLALVVDYLAGYISHQFSEHTAVSLAYASLLIIFVSLICCIIISMMREEERRIRERYRKLGVSDQSSLAAAEAADKRRTSRSSVALSSQSSGSRGSDGSTGRLLANPSSCNTAATSYLRSRSSPAGGVAAPSPTSSGLLGSILADLNESLNSSLGHQHQHLHQQHASRSPDPSRLRIHELRRETYFGLVRLLKPGCRTVVLLCDSQSKIKLLSKFYKCVYPYRKNKTLQFAFLLIEKNIVWYKDLLRMALNEPRDLHINPINCLGTVLVLNGFKKYFSVYHASDSRYDPNEEFILLEESLLDHLSEWLERLFAGKTNRYYVRYWPEKMR